MRSAIVLACLAAGTALAAPGCGPTRRQLIEQGITDFQVGRLDQAENKLSQALEKRFTDADALFFMGRICQVRGRHERAIYYYQCCLDVAPGYDAAKKHLAEARQQAGLMGSKLGGLPIDPGR